MTASLFSSEPQTRGVTIERQWLWGVVWMLQSHVGSRVL
jgi:hypothetical protein